MWTHDHGDGFHSRIPVFVCLQCCFVGIYETLRSIALRDAFIMALN
jgi:hypothetical protein